MYPKRIFTSKFVIVTDLGIYWGIGFPWANAPAFKNNPPPMRGVKLEYDIYKRFGLVYAVGQYARAVRILTKEFYLAVRENI